MTEIPEHLLKRAQEAKAKAAAKKGDGGAAAAEGGAGGAGDDAGKIPAHLLARSQAARAAGGGDGGGVATAERPGGAVATLPGAGAQAPPLATGPEGHTQRLLTVVKAGSIQDVKAKPVDKVHTWPHLLVGEFVATLAITAFLLVFSAFVNAPLLSLANFNLTPNPSKAPWYFLGLQELLTMFHPMVAGVTIPGMGIFALMLAPYSDKNPSARPEDRKFAIMLFTIFVMFWAVLVIIGSFFRGPGFNFTFPWNDGVFFDL
ncbi:MAG: menaquinol-cytochrome c reductase cytochrome b subunit [Actinomycetota bacterium]|jgi:menaquinol-cytochrome c reductase cytochrome b/c subunit|nr:menaquinol-cytochrome c reductase cytochrome b subunit [Actinomycetota bacterium]